MIVGRRDYIKILKLLRQKNLGNDFNFIYDNINKIDNSMIDNSNIKDAHKKLFKLYIHSLKESNTSNNNNNINLSIDDINDNVKEKIKYGNISDRIGDIYISQSDDCYCNNILIPYGSKLFYSNNKWYYKHIEITKPEYTSNYKNNISYSEYKNISNGDINTINSEIINIGSKPSPLQQYGVRFQ